jgi:lycopene cyclase domain-containing protein
MSLYAWLMAGSFIVPFLFSFGKKVAYYKLWPSLFVGIIVNAIFLIIWDGYFVRMGVWRFNPEYVWNIRLNDLPVEEWLFFFVIPYCSIFIYANLKVFIKKNPIDPYKHYITLFFVSLTFVLALFNTQKAYTFYNCLFAFILLSIHYLIWKKDWMGYFWLAYIIHLIPFFIVNGILTAKPMVIYNNLETLGIRLYSIPVEDTIYALICLLLPITIMEWLQGKATSKKALPAVEK